ncbi:MAG: hypothetical protein KF880_07465 [Ferruginibacter sp.]|nr:hypothetical protein [Ferruginibacter sp.]
MTTTDQTPNLQLHESKLDSWFSGLIDQLKLDHFMLSSDIAPEDKKSFYHDIINGNYDGLMRNMRETSSMYFISEILKDYVNILKGRSVNPLKLAIGLSNSKILIWAETENDDEKTEDALLLAEAFVNSKYAINGFYINSTIIEKSDNLPIPPHYQTLIS